MASIGKMTLSDDERKMTGLLSTVETLNINTEDKSFMAPFLYTLDSMIDDNDSITVQKNPNINAHNVLQIGCNSKEFNIYVLKSRVPNKKALLDLQERQEDWYLFIFTSHQNNFLNVHYMNGTDVGIEKDGANNLLSNKQCVKDRKTDGYKGHYSINDGEIKDFFTTENIEAPNDYYALCKTFVTIIKQL